MSQKHRVRRGGTPRADEEFARTLEGYGRDGFSSGRHGAHKARQLCRQVQRALSLALAEQDKDGVYDDVFIEDVTLADGGHLLVYIVVPADRAVSVVLASLREDAARIRADVAAAIHRKRAPELSFLPAWPAGGNDV